MINLSFREKITKVFSVITLTTMLMNVFAPAVYASELINQRKLVQFNSKTGKSLLFSALRINKYEVISSAEKSSNNLKVSANGIVENSKMTMAGGPGQNETSGYTLSSTDGMVDKFTGDFSYTIPLANIEGYEVSIHYNSNVNMNTEASWVGLGWDLNLGAVSRSMRGLPDEFNGKQEIKKTFNQEEDYTEGGKKGGYLAYQLKSGIGNTDKYAGLGLQVTALWGKYNNTYLGLGKTFDFGLQASASLGYEKSGWYIAPSFGLGYSSDSKRGVGTNTTYGLSAGRENGTDGGVQLSAGYSFGTSFHSRQGMVAKVHSLDAGFGWDINRLGAKVSYGTSSVLPYGSISSVPSVRLNSYGYSVSDGGNFYGGVSFGVNTIKVGFLTTDFYTNIAISKNSNSQIIQPAIGYFHNGKYDNYAVSHNENGTTAPLMDFNRINDYEYSQEMSNLAFSFQTYDIFNVSAMGFGGTFRGYRSDVGTYEDAASKMANESKGNEVTLGAVVKTGTPQRLKVEIANSSSKGEAEVHSGEFTTIDDENNRLHFKNESAGNKFDQSVYFKAVGEMTPVDLTDLSSMGGNQWAYPTFKLVNEKEIRLAGDLKFKNGSSTVISSSALNAQNNRVSANYFKPYTAHEYSQLAGEGSFLVYQGSNFINETRVQATNPNAPYYYNHLSAVESVGMDGTRYVFGIPAYELKSAQVTFSASGLNDADGDGVIQFDPGDNTTGNSKGLSHFFEKTEVPSYAHSFLLTEVLSSDYVDRTNNGPSLDDVGNYYNFKYTRIFNQTTPYKWRFPLGDKTAMFNRGVLGTNLDDNANYAYGEKEIWYVKEIESKNLIAEFILEDRIDACGVLGEEGMIDASSKLKRLKYIKVYNRSERTGSNGANAVPLQIIEFQYTYELCKGNPANSNTNGSNPNYNESGKLTLNKIISYNGNSEEMALYHYEFNYGTGADNPDFSYVTDAWGKKKAINAQKPNDVYPYADQDLNTANINAKAWKLNKISTPSNGAIEVEYESDTYKTVQDTRTMTHIDLKGMMSIARLSYILQTNSWNTSQDLTDRFVELNSGSATSQDHQFMEDYMNLTANFDGLPVTNVMVFKLPKTIAASNTFQDAQTLMQDLYFKDEHKSNSLITDIFFKSHVAIKDNTTELVPLFAKVDQSYGNVQSIGILPPSNSGGDFDYGYVILKPAVLNDEDGKKRGYVYHPIQKAALEFSRRNLPDVVYGATASASADQKLILDKSVALHKTDINSLMISKNWCSKLIYDFSSLRVYNPIKYGGNGRVSKITYKDNWLEMSGENIPGLYVWKYSYDDEYGTTGNAAFEPMQVIDESALYWWETYLNIRKKYPDETKFTATPIAAPLYPDPIIGYNKVRVSIEGVENRGFSETEFFTSYDKPVFFDKSNIDKTVETDKPSNVLTGKTTDRFAFSQGFYIETNDFHGKIERSSIFAYDNPLLGQISQPVLQAQTTYQYKDLGTTIPMVKNNGVVQNEYVAQDVDIHTDTRFVTNEVTNRDIKIGISLTLLSAAPYCIPWPIFGLSKSSRTEAFYSSALVKHVNRSAIVSGIETRSFNSQNFAENILYDYYSGNVLLSSLNDEYNDKLYSFEYPSHWYYKELRDIASSQSSKVTFSINSSGVISGMDHVLTPGDVLVIDQSTCPTCVNFAWVAKRNTSTNGDLFLMTVNGTNAFGLAGYMTSAGTYTAEIVKSNRDNRLMETMENFVTKKSLFNTTTNILSLPTDASSEIISSSVLTYKDRNNVKCGIPSSKENPYSNNEATLNETMNPYLYGIRGDLVMDDSFTWQSERVQAAHDYKTRFDGTYQNFIPFYTLSSGNWLKHNFVSEPPVATSGWRPSGIVSTYDSYGKPLESKNTLNLYSSVLFGYNALFNLVPVASAMNARQQEIVFEGFEDKLYYSNFASIPNNVPHFNLNYTSVDLTTRHSGLGSLLLTGLSSATATAKVESACTALQASDGTSNSFTVQECNCIDPFKPTLGSYIIGAWVKNDNPATQANGTISVSINGATTPNYTFSASGPVIDGWQRIEGTFLIDNPGNISQQIVTISLNHVSGASVNFDDLRIHPEMAVMTTTVYDAKTLLPIATHDGNNFTTFYNYDENFNLVRTRVETIEGIKTVSETESGGNKK